MGHPERGDDGLGPAVVQALGQRLPGATVHLLAAVGPDLCERWGPGDRVLLVDAVVSGAPPGTVHRLDPAGGPLPELAGRASSHALGLGQALELARLLGRLPAAMTLVGVEAAQAAPGAPLSPPVAAALPALVDALEAELRA